MQWLYRCPPLHTIRNISCLRCFALNRLHAPLFFLRTRRVSRGTAFSLLPLDAAQLLPRSNDNQARQGRLPFSGTFSVQPVAHTTSTGPFVSRAVGLTKQGPSYNLEQPQYSTSTVTAAATHSVTGIIPAVPTADVGYLSHTRARSRAPSPSATNRAAGVRMPGCSLGLFCDLPSQDV